MTPFKIFNKWLWIGLDKLKNKTHTHTGDWITAAVQDSHTCRDRLTSVQPCLNTHCPPSNSSPLTPGATRDCLLCSNWSSSETTALSSSWVWLREALSKFLCGLIPCFSNGSAMEKKKNLSPNIPQTLQNATVLLCQRMHAPTRESALTHTPRICLSLLLEEKTLSPESYFPFRATLFFFSEFALQFSRASSWCLEHVRAGVKCALSICEPD